MLLKFSFVSTILALAAAQEFYDRFDIRDAIDDAIDDYLIARDRLWEVDDLVERSLPSAGTCGVSIRGVFGCIPRGEHGSPGIGDEPCGKCRPGTHGVSCLCDSLHHQLEHANPASPNEHGSASGGGSVNGGSVNGGSVKGDNVNGGSVNGGSVHGGSTIGDTTKEPDDILEDKVPYPDVPDPLDTSDIVKVRGKCERYNRGGVQDKLCKFKSPSTGASNKCSNKNRGFCYARKLDAGCNCEVERHKYYRKDNGGKTSNGGSSDGAKKKVKPTPPGPIHQ